jgi:hypothetical protein
MSSEKMLSAYGCVRLSGVKSIGSCSLRFNMRGGGDILKQSGGCITTRLTLDGTWPA